MCLTQGIKRTFRLNKWVIQTSVDSHLVWYGFPFSSTSCITRRILPDIYALIGLWLVRASLQKRISLRWPPKIRNPIIVTTWLDWPTLLYFIFYTESPAYKKKKNMFGNWYCPKLGLFGTVLNGSLQEFYSIFFLQKLLFSVLVFLDASNQQPRLWSDLVSVQADLGLPSVGPEQGFLVTWLILVFILCPLEICS